MKGALFTFILTAILICGGCGGSGSSTSSIEPGFYRGTFNISTDGGPTGPAPMFLDIVDRNDWAGEATAEDYFFSVSKSATGASLVGTIVATGEATMNGGEEGVNFTFNNEGITASGELIPAELPILGPVATVPSEGTYVGEFFVVVDGRVRTMGSATANVDAQGNVTTFLEGGTGVTTDGILAGEFEANGALSGASFFHGGTNTTLAPAPAYSWDGTKLVVQFGQNLFNDNGYCWLSLSPQS